MTRSGLIILALLSCSAVSTAGDRNYTAFEELDSLVGQLGAEPDGSGQAALGTKLMRSATTLAKVGDREQSLVAIGRIMTLLDHQNIMVQLWATGALSNFGPDARLATPRLLRMARDRYETNRALLSIVAFDPLDDVCIALSKIVPNIEYEDIQWCLGRPAFIPQED